MFHRGLLVGVRIRNVTIKSSYDLVKGAEPFFITS